MSTPAPTAVPTVPEPVAAWHRLAKALDPTGLDDLLADDCVFRSPAVRTPQEGRALSAAYLAAAFVVLGPTLRYVEEWYAGEPGGPGSAVLQFEAEVDGPDGRRLSVHGVDMLRWGADQRLTSFTVMIRPMKGLQAVIGAMGAELTTTLSKGTS